MIIKTAEFVMSNTELKKCPEANLHEYAFIGRSNVGKSSLINMLTNHSKLAKISSSPGKTQCINHFIINKNWYLVDLPGYGYAKVSKTNRALFSKMIEEYLTKRSSLVCVFVLIDSRIPPQKIDLEFTEFLGIKGIPFVLVFTKSDKLSSSALNRNLNTFQNEFLKTWEELPEIFISSAQTARGREEILSYIHRLNTDIDLSLLKIT